MAAFSVQLCRRYGVHEFLHPQPVIHIHQRRRHVAIRGESEHDELGLRGRVEMIQERIVGKDVDQPAGELRVP